MALLLLVEDERLLRWALHSRLQSAGHTVHDASTLAEAEEQLRRIRPQVVILDVNLPDGNGLDFLSAQKEKLADSSVIVVTADGSIADAVRAMKVGASDFLSKPVDQEELLRLVNAATVRQRERLEVEGSRRAREKSKVRVVATSAAMKNVLAMADTVASAPSTTVLINGETGAGKEVVARYIHACSPRANAPLQALNCAALPENLVESELFGNEKGAFTDAKVARKGLFELADGGTVVLDEIGEIPLSLQAKLLRFLEERTLRRLGGSREITVDVRVLALTNRDLRTEVAQGRFREDLYYRLNVFPITIPPLRQRREDILPMALDFVRHFGSMCGRRYTALSPELEQRLLEHHWPGNVRELRNLMERAAIVEQEEIVTGQNLAFDVSMHAPSGNGSSSIGDAIIPLEELELMMVQRALRAADGNQSKAARLLQVSRDQLRYRVKRYREMGRLSPELAGEDGFN
jgi:two-component system, NtrC family, response regulator AtoC